jgi:hypothetical protein
MRVVEMIALLLVGTTTAAIDRWIDDVVAGRDRLPSLAAVQEASVRALELTPSDSVEGWEARARWRGLVPRLEARFGTTADQSVRDGATGTAWQISEGQNLGVDVAAKWNLGELVFNDLELRANRERIARAARVALVRERATAIYFERVRVLIAARSAPTEALAIEAARLDGMLRAITGGLLEERLEANVETDVEAKAKAKAKAGSKVEAKR